MLRHLIQFTGITPILVEDAPTFSDLWPILEPIFDSGLLIAHNAVFDIGVLSKCLRSYGIQWQLEMEYACTVQMGRCCYPRLRDHKLNTLCNYLGIRLDHHQAGSDSRACACLLINYLCQKWMAKNICIVEFMRYCELNQSYCDITMSISCVPNMGTRWPLTTDQLSVKSELTSLRIMWYA